MKTVPETHHDLINDESKAFLFLGTTMANGSPQVTVMWFNVDDEHIYVNSVAGRTKDKNMRVRPHVSMGIQDYNKPYHFMQIQGRVIEIKEDENLEHINQLAIKYTGEGWTPHEGEIRVVYKIQLDKVIAH